MTNEKILEKLYQAGKQIKDFDIAMSIIRKCDGVPAGSGDYSEPDFVIAELIYTLETESKIKAMKKSGKSDLLAAAKSILKTAKKGPKQGLYTAFTCNDRQVFCDGYRALIISGADKLDLQTNPDQVFDISTAEKNIVKCNYSVLPTAADLQTEITRFKNLYGKKDRIVCRFFKNNELAIAFNSEFLLDAIKATAGDKVYYNSHKSTSIIETGNIKALLCPINTTNIKTIGVYHYIDIDENGTISITTEEIAA